MNLNKKSERKEIMLEIFNILHKAEKENDTERQKNGIVEAKEKVLDILSYDGVFIFNI